MGALIERNPDSKTIIATLQSAKLNEQLNSRSAAAVFCCLTLRWNAWTMEPFSVGIRLKATIAFERRSLSRWLFTENLNSGFLHCNGPRKLLFDADLALLALLIDLFMSRHFKRHENWIIFIFYEWTSQTFDFLVKGKKLHLNKDVKWRDGCQFIRASPPL